MMTRAFIRVDDVGRLADRDSLEAMLEAFVPRGFPLHLAVVPAWLTPESASHLREALLRYPSVEIGQHGFAHEWHGPGGEFGGRPVDVQQRDILEGMRILDREFGDRFVPVFTPPWGLLDADTVQALRWVSFRVFSRGVRLGRKSGILSRLGSGRGRLKFAGIPISHHRTGWVGLDRDIAEISAVLDPIADYERGIWTPAPAFAAACRRRLSRRGIAGLLLHPPRGGVFTTPRGEPLADWLSAVAEAIAPQPGVEWLRLWEIAERRYGLKR